MGNNRATMKDLCLMYMQEYGKITQLDAYREFGYTRLSDAIYKLKADGWKIRKTINKGVGRLGNKVHFAAYSLEEEE